MTVPDFNTVEETFYASTMLTDIVGKYNFIGIYISVFY